MVRYEPSGRFGAALLPALLLCAAVGAGLAWVYQWLINLIPFIYVNLLLTLGFGFVLLTMVLTALRAGRNRNHPLALAAAVVLPVIAVIASFGWGYRLALPDLYEQVAKEGA